MSRRFRITIAAAALAVFGATAAAADVPAPAVPEGRCAELAAARLKDVEIVSAAFVPAGAPVPGVVSPTARDPNGGRPVSGLPAFCRVIGRIRPEPGSDIGFEVWLPQSGWTGRLTGAGNGGYAGSIFSFMLIGAVRAGEAGVSTDGGHRGGPSDASWAPGHPERVRDFGWRSIHLSAVAAKALVARYYGRPADHAYFIGYSNGGRQALVEASRFPEDYDGVLAGAPAADWTRTHVSQLWALQAQLPPRARIRPAQAKLLQAEVLRQCDQLDGQLDGLVDDPRRCKLDASRLGCGGAQASPDCFAPAQIAALERIYAGRKDAEGRWIAPPFLPAGSEVSDPLFGWDRVIFTLGDKPDAAWADKPVLALNGRTIATVGAFDFDRDPQRLKAANAFGELDASPDLRRFFARGGKLILWQGWADPDVPPQIALDYRDEVLRVSGPQAARSMRLFMVPGLQHGVGGKGADLFGQLLPPPKGATPDSNVAAALEAWVETGRVPESLVGKRHSSGATDAGAPPAHAPRERLLCGYPARAVLTPGADPDRGASYVCRE
jgi:feruloyl esterase